MLHKTKVVTAFLLFGLMIFLHLGVSGRGQSKGAQPIAEIPFEFLRNQIVVQVKVSGQGPFNMIFDTDTDPFAIDLATARSIGLKLGSKGLQGTGGGTEVNLAYPTKLPEVDLGGVTVKDVYAAAIDLTKLSARLGKPIHGVVGYSFLKDKIFQIDYRASKVRFFAESPYPGILKMPDTISRTAVAFHYEDDVLIDSVLVNGQKLRATLDTGGSNTFSLTPQGVLMLGLEDEVRNAKEETSAGYNGQFTNKTGSLKSVRIGALSIDSARVSFLSTGTGYDKRKFQVSIGNGFLKDYLLTFDFRAKIVVFEKPD